MNTQGQRTNASVSAIAFSGTPSWGCTYNGTGEPRQPAGADVDGQ